MDKRGRGISRFSNESFLSHRAENLRKESFTVAIISGTQKVWIRRGVGVSRYSVENILAHNAENFIFVGESFTVALFSGIGKFWIRRGSNKIFRRKTFVSQSRKLL